MAQILKNPINPINPINPVRHNQPNQAKSSQPGIIESCRWPGLAWLGLTRLDWVGRADGTDWVVWTAWGWGGVLGASDLAQCERVRTDLVCDPWGLARANLQRSYTNLVPMDIPPETAGAVACYLVAFNVAIQLPTSSLRKCYTQQYARK